MLLIGTGGHDEATSGLKPIHSVEHTLLDLQQTFVKQCGVPKDAIVPLFDPATPAEVVAHLNRVREDADDVLWVHFVGHGLVFEEPSGDGAQERLFLATLSTTTDEYQGQASSVRYEQIRMMMLRARAAVRVIVLDCCFSGLAIGMAGEQHATQIKRLTRIDMVHVLTATAGSQRAMAPDDEPHTAFTGAFIKFLRTGSAESGRELTISDAFHFLSTELPRRHAMSPQQMDVGNNTDRLVLAPNPAYVRQPPVLTPSERSVSGDVRAPCPYPDARSVTAGTARWIYGRQDEIDELVAHLERRFDRGGPVVLRAAPGSGTTSLLRAGLIPSLMARGLSGHPGSGDWPWSVIGLAPDDGRRRPDPLAALAAAGAELVLSPGRDNDVTALTGRMRTDPQAFATLLRSVLSKRAGTADPAATRVILVIDEYEELDRLPADDPDRAAFVAALNAACLPAGGRPAPALLLVAAHTDASDPCGVAGLSMPEGVENAGPYVLPPLAGWHLREAIEAPAQEVGTRVSPELAGVVEYDLDSAVPEPRRPGAVALGRLPLVVRALRAAWDHLEDSGLTVNAYRAGGGIRAAAAALAQDAYDELEGAERDAARTLLLRMVRIETDSESIRRVDLAQLIADSREPATARRAADLLVRRHVIVRDGDRSRLLHQEMTRWGLLREWISADRAALVEWQRLLNSAEEWNDARRDAARLPREHDLKVAQTLKREHRELFTPRLELFVDEGSARQVDRQRRRVAGLAVALAVIVALAVAALSFGVEAVHQRSQAADQRDLAESEAIAAAADALRAADPAAAALLAVDSYAVSPMNAKSISSLLSNQADTPAQRIPVGHDGVNAVAASSAGSYGAFAATADEDGTVCVVPVDSAAQQPVTLPAHMDRAPVYAVAASPDGRQIGAGHSDGSVDLWDRGRRGWTLVGTVTTTGRDAVNAVAFSADGGLLAVGGDDGTIWLWPTTAFRGAAIAHSATGRGPVEAVAFASTDAHTIVAGNTDKTATILSLSRTSSPTLSVRHSMSAGTQPVDAVAVSPGGNTVATGDDDGTVRLWGTDGTSRALLSGSGSRAEDVAFSPDGRTLAESSEDGAVRLWDTGTGTVNRVLTGPGPHISGLAYLRSATQSDILVGAGSGGVLGLWPVDSRTPSAAGRGSGQVFDTAVFGAPGRHVVATAGTDKVIRLWHPGTPAPFAVVADPIAAPLPETSAAPADPPPGPMPTRHVAFSPDGSQMAFIGQSGKIVVWDLGARRELMELAVGLPSAGTAPVATTVAYSDDGTMLAATNSDRDLLVWDTRRLAGRPRVLPLVNQLDPINAIAFRADGLLASASDDRTVDLAYIAPAPRPLRESTLSPTAAGHLSPVEAVAFGGDHDELLASADTDGETRLWSVNRTDTSTGSSPPTPQPLTILSGPTQAVVSVAFSGDGSLLASASEDGTVTLWSMSGQHAVVATLSGLPAPSSAAVDPDSQSALLVTSDDGGMAQFWSTDTYAVARQSCADHGALTVQQWERYVPGQPYIDGCALLAGAGSSATASAAGVGD